LTGAVTGGALFAAAMAARQRGDEQGWLSALTQSAAREEDPRCLNMLGNFRLNGGDAAGAIELLRRATAADPQAPPLWFNLSLACRALGDRHGELGAISRALALDAYFLQAIIHRGSALEAIGLAAEAGKAFKDALACARGQPDSAARLPPSLLEVAKAGAARHAQALEAHLADQTAAIIARHGHGDARRFAEMLEIFHGRQSYQVQQPTFMCWPGLPPLSFHDRRDFPWLAGLEAATGAMRSELLAVLADDAADLEPYINHPDGRPLAQWEALNRSSQWSAYHLLRHGKPVEAHTRRCPQTMAALAQCETCDVPGNAPNAFFSVLKPRTRIPAHTGMTNTRLVVHLPLIVPQGCGFRVGNEARPWVAGEAWVFDDTMDHEAWNDSDQQRIILITDCWHPHLSAMERDLVRAFFEGLRSFGAAESLSAGL
jgi:aspartate beta-hydroxylase